ncbi:MAG TPA: alpha/beta hydrolase [Steroidobacteraceae bacterium]
MAKQPKFSTSTNAVRTRRAYFDCKFGQLHVRTAFPTTGGFDEGTTLFCLHPSEGSSRTFDRFLPEIADDRSVYAPDLPGCGESDPAPTMEFADAASAVADLAADLRLRRIDVLGFRFGAGVALELGAARPELVRRLVLVGVPPLDRLPVIKQESLVLRMKLGAGGDSQWTTGTLPNAKFIDLAEYTADLFDAAPKTLAKQIGAFLKE